MLTKEQEKICKKHFDSVEGCENCPLVLSFRNSMCRANAHYDNDKNTWVKDDPLGFCPFNEDDFGPFEEDW